MTKNEQDTKNHERANKDRQLTPARLHQALVDQERREPTGMQHLLVISEESSPLAPLVTQLEMESLSISFARGSAEALHLMEDRSPDAVLLALPASSANLDLCTHLRRIAPFLPVVVVSEDATPDVAIEIIKRGAFDHLFQPVDPQHLTSSVAKALAARRLPSQFPIVAVEVPTEGDAHCLVGRSLPMQEVYKVIGQAGPQDVTVLILGESGTGKELVARALHEHSPRCKELFLVINCAAIPETLLESELFGYERGAFTGAERRRTGKVELADRGTIFLDEIGDLPLSSQAKLLRLLQEKSFERLGGNRTIKTHARIIAATNQNLDAMAGLGHFRRDLLYRLNGFMIQLPPLRDRVSDVPLLVDHFLNRFNREMGKEVVAVGWEAMRLLEDHVWPGNVRELQNVIHRAVLYAKDFILSQSCLPRNFQVLADPPPPSAEGWDLVAEAQRLLVTGQGDIQSKINQKVNRLLLAEVLRFTKGNQFEQLIS